MGNRLSKIYTRTGDDGSTGLGDGTRVPKDSARVASYGTIDEANSAIGLLLADDAVPDDIRDLLVRIQHQLFDLGGELCIPGHAAIHDADIDALERALDAHNAGLPPLKEFILPGGGEASARCHLARTIVRRAERDQAVKLAEQHLIATERTKSYIGGHGDPLFGEQLLRLVLGEQSPALSEGRAGCTQTPVPITCNAFLLNTLARGARHLEANADKASAGLDRVTAWAGAITAALVIQGGVARLARGESGLARALGSAQSDDGGLISRTPYEQVQLVDRLGLLRSAYFAAKHNPPESLETAAAAALSALHGVILGDGGAFRIEDFSLPRRAADAAPAPAPLRPTGDDLNLDRAERQMVEAALRKHGYNISSAATELGVSRAALYRRMEKYGL